MSHTEDQHTRAGARRSGESSPGAAPGLAEDVVRALVAAAAAAREHAYAPYSAFDVGAALLGEDGAIYVGCNVENASYGLTICAERSAVAVAVSQGVRHFTAVAVVTENGVAPCGACRQVLAEFNQAMTVIIADTRGNMRSYPLTELLPDSFKPEHLDRKSH